MVDGAKTGTTTFVCNASRRARCLWRIKMSKHKSLDQALEQVYRIAAYDYERVSTDDLQTRTVELAEAIVLIGKELKRLKSGLPVVVTLEDPDDYVDEDEVP
jgi:hypothetical protein